MPVHEHHGIGGKVAMVPLEVLTISHRLVAATQDRAVDDPGVHVHPVPHPQVGVFGIFTHKLGQNRQKAGLRTDKKVACDTIG